MNSYQATHKTYPNLVLASDAAHLFKQYMHEVLRQRQKLLSVSERASQQPSNSVSSV